ncbi:hypothetical protein E4U17_002575 [Claviceps sp. LM77 group G4]|nr:hypothetical protein E4U17_002575 [Claviceps sp. LM77 group G4]KAG6076348.1 hypothetical protein E4U16_002845 [Claviceps sp. LM84 group G4]KAG6076783.1 hypothetical protein E4U33_001655 [Claviceps sp. LM78 group G4]
MKFNTLSTMMGFLALGASVSARAISEPIAHQVVPTWEAAIDPEKYQDYLDGDTTLVKGTIQQVDSYMEAHYPGWSAKHAKFASPYWNPPDSEKAPTKSVMCNYPGLHQASTRAVLRAIDDLRNISEHRGPKWQPRPGTCGKLSCTDGGAIFWCNDRHKPKVKTLDGVYELVAAAEAIISHCAMSGDTLMPMVSGKTTVLGDYTFVVGKSSCGADF